MAHWAEIDEKNIVVRVTVGDNNVPDQGYQWLIDNLGGTWIQTSYNSRIRKNFAGIGMTYDSVRDAFIEPKPFDSWLLNEDTCRWQPPIPVPRDGKLYFWSESNLLWTEVLL